MRIKDLQSVDWVESATKEHSNCFSPVRGTCHHQEALLRVSGKESGLPFQELQGLDRRARQGFWRYSVEALVVDTGKVYQQTCAGVLIAEGGKIKLLREALNTAAARAFSKD
jgi:hypothetical protein